MRVEKVMSDACKNGNHVIGCGFEGAETLHSYIDNSRKHPGYYFKYCPECGKRIISLDAMADVFESYLLNRD